MTTSGNLKRGKLSYTCLGNPDKNHNLTSGQNW